MGDVAKTGEFYSDAMKASFDLDEVERRFDAGDTVDAVAADLGVTPRTIRNHLHAAGRPLLQQRRGGVINPHGPDWVRPEVLDDPDWLHNRYVVEVMSVAELARELGVAHGTVHSALIRHDIEPRKRLGSLDIDSDWLHDQYVVRRHSLKGIASDAGVGISSIRRAAKRDGLTRERLRTEIDSAWLHEQYIVRRRSLNEIGSEIGLDGRTVGRAVKRNGLSRDRSRIVIDDAWLHKQWVVQHRTMRDIAAELGVSRSTRHCCVDGSGPLVACPGASSSPSCFSVVCWFPVPARRDLVGGALVPAVRAVIPRRRRAARGTWHRR